MSDQTPLYGRPFVDSDGSNTGLEVLGVIRSSGSSSAWSEVAVEYLSPLQPGGPAAPVVSVSTRSSLEPLWRGCALDVDQAREAHRLLAGAIARAEGETQRSALDTAVAALHGAEQQLTHAEEARLQALIALRKSGVTWAELGERLGVSRHEARTRYARTLWGLDEGRPLALPAIVSDRPVLPPPVAPVIGEPAIDDARAWCRWCGDRLVLDGSWRHTTGPDSMALAHQAVADEPHEPWPVEED